jgi:hypothetical protein
MKVYQAVQNILVGDRQTGDLLSLLLCLESMLKIKHFSFNKCSYIGNLIKLFSFKDEIFIGGALSVLNYIRWYAS